MNEKPHSLILASGTLSPMDIIESEIGVKFHLKKEFKHVIQNN
jgi:Rad3-related DNA helicase